MVFSGVEDPLPATSFQRLTLACHTTPRGPFCQRTSLENRFRTILVEIQAQVWSHRPLLVTAEVYGVYGSTVKSPVAGRRDAAG